MGGMFPAIPPDVAILGTVVIVFLIIGLPLITRRVFLPRRIEFATVAEHDLTPSQTSYFGGLDASLRPMGYRPQGNWMPVNMQQREKRQLLV